MRISDWSSDVCSSDLLDLRRKAEAQQRGRRLHVSFRADQRDLTGSEIRGEHGVADKAEVVGHAQQACELSAVTGAAIVVDRITTDLAKSAEPGVADIHGMIVNLQAVRREPTGTRPANLFGARKRKIDKTDR